MMANIPLSAEKSSDLTASYSTNNVVMATDRHVISTLVDDSLEVSLVNVHDTDVLDRRVVP